MDFSKSIILLFMDLLMGLFQTRFDDLIILYLIKMIFLYDTILLQLLLLLVLVFALRTRTLLDL